VAVVFVVVLGAMGMTLNSTATSASENGWYTKARERV
jgi:hypothetical protein